MENEDSLEAGFVVNGKRKRQKLGLFGFLFLL